MRTSASASGRAKLKKTATRRDTAPNIFEELGFSAKEGRHALLKAELLSQILDVVRARGLSQKELAALWKKPQPRVSEVLNGKLYLVSIDTLVEFLEHLGLAVQLKVRRA